MAVPHCEVFVVRLIEFLALRDAEDKDAKPGLSGVVDGVVPSSKGSSKRHAPRHERKKPKRPKRVRDSHKTIADDKV